MIARVWDGVTEARSADEYVEYLRRTGVADLTATEGNRGVYVLRRTEGDRARFRLISLWESMEGIGRFAGRDPEKARYYPEDERFLRTLEPRVEHYEVAIAPGGEAASLADELWRIWRGDAGHGPALLELLEGVSPARAAARPIAGGHSIWDLVLHDAGWTEVFRRRLDGEAVEEPSEGDFPVPPEPCAEAWAEAQARLRTAHERLAERVARLSPEELEAKVPGRDFSARFLVRSAIRHTLYHSGQIGLLKKAP